MALVFEHSASVDIPDVSFAIIHTPDNKVILLTLEEGNPVKRVWNPGLQEVDWASPEFSKPSLVFGSAKGKDWRRVTSLGEVGIMYAD